MSGFSAAELARVAAAASTLEERLDGTWVTAVPDAELAERRLNEWRRTVAGGDPVLFARRLAWSGLDEPSVRRALGGAVLRAPADPPAWTARLQELTAELEGAEVEAAPHPFYDPDFALPFEDLVAPIVRLAGRRLAERARPGLELLADGALAGLQRALLKRIAIVAADSIYRELAIFRSRQMSGIDLLFYRARGEIGRELYLDFAAHLRAGGWQAFFLEYAPLSRLLVTIVEYWVDAAAEFLERLAGDLDAIAQELHDGRPPGRVRELLSLLSDTHNQGRLVVVVTFESGLKLVYKPRDVAIEARWFDLLDWINRQGGMPELRRLRLLGRPHWGWVEFLEHRPCRTPDEARRFYFRSGMLVGLVYAMGGSDFHYENFIASGEQPVLIDLEAIMQHSPRENFFGVNVEQKLERSLGNSVLRTGMLPRWQIGEGGRAIDVSALGAVIRQEKHVPIQVWSHINTDLMEPRHEFGATQPGANAPLLADRNLSPNDYLDDIEAGFRAMYRFLTANRAALAAGDSALAPLREQSVRYIFRPTASYYNLLLDALRPSVMRDGADRSIRLDRLAATLLSSEARPVTWQLLEVERAALTHCDFPIFTAKASGTALDPECGGIDGLFSAPCFDETLARLQKLDEADLEKQASLLRAAFQSRVLGQETPADRAPETATAEEEGAPLSRDEMIARAAAIGDRLRRAAIDVGPGEMIWITLASLQGQHRFQLDTIGPDLFEGGSGIALLFAALARVTGEAEWRDAAHAVLAPIRRDLQETAARRSGQGARVHGLSGWASLGYALPRTAAMLGEPEIAEPVCDLLSIVTPAAIAEDRGYDLLNGTAGTLLAMLAAWNSTGDEAFLARATACGEHLLAGRTAAANGLRAWVTLENQLITGFSHGAAGIAYALLRLGSATGDARFRAAAEEAILYEASTFSVEHGNWPDFRWSPNHPSFLFADGWCHGGPGVALGRLGGLDVLDTPAVRADIAAGLALAHNTGASRMDHLCCGNAGRLGILFEAGRQLGDGQVLDQARGSLGQVVRRAEARGSYRLWYQPSGCVSMPGLFQGLSGIGYLLLRFAAPEEVGGVLLLQ
ncbi:MAG TPA: type 2 lanthipeptide synthetase LanM family protein [Thermoanaerobaculia bacterium]|jgi:type 2 lantibiotic biosynthesis protein LanM|nr:type 2 lanthipeptide synthetase LanM family protein [Thermoanaerobaculia bacterium]